MLGLAPASRSTFASAFFLLFGYNVQRSIPCIVLNIYVTIPRPFHVIQHQAYQLNTAAHERVVQNRHSPGDRRYRGSLCQQEADILQCPRPKN